MMPFSFESIQSRSPYRIQDKIRHWIDESLVHNPIKRADIEAYNYRAGSFNTHVPLSARSESALAPILQLPKDAVILELGGGEGRFGITLMQRGFRNVIESDISSASVMHAMRSSEAQGLEGHFCTMDSEDIPLKDNSVDAVFMVASLHHVPSASKALAGMKRVLKPGGLLCILHEPASWQYYVFFLLFKLVRIIVRRDANTPHSLADDITFGFTQRYFRRHLRDMKSVRILPVHYTRKVYTNLIDLYSRLLKKKPVYRTQILHLCETLDRIISNIPLVRSFAWDWDIYAIK